MQNGNFGQKGHVILQKYYTNIKSMLQMPKVIEKHIQIR